MKLRDVRIAVVGLGYVGLPLAVEFGKKYEVLGYDINTERVDQLKSGHDRTLEVSDEELASTTVTYTDDPTALAAANFFIVTTPTPIDAHKRPDLGSLLSASKTIGQHLNPGDIVVYESTVYPGATEDDCVPVLAQNSGLEFNRDFFVGYSPERINPGDKDHRVSSILKITSGSNPETADFVDTLYASIITAGTHKASSIRVAEAAKVIENTQRDVNIALINELAILFNRLGIDTRAVLEAAGTKWNFQPFRPGLVGGHCIGVDPYYLTHKAQAVGYHPQIILAGRRVNDGMGVYVAARVLKLLAATGKPLRGAHVLILGLTFKENTPDLRNTRVMDVVRELTEYGIHVSVHDPWVVPEEAELEYGLQLEPDLVEGIYDGVILAVAHDAFRSLRGNIARLLVPGGVIFDVKAFLPECDFEGRL